jgi:hypothetical protein
MMREKINSVKICLNSLKIGMICNKLIKVGTNGKRKFKR